MGGLLIGVAWALVALALISVGLRLGRGRRRRQTGFGGVWLNIVYAENDSRFRGSIERIDVVMSRDGLRRSHIRGVSYRIFDRREVGTQECPYRFRGRISGGVESAFFWSTTGTGTGGTWLLIHDGRDEMAGEYARRPRFAETALPAQRFPVRRLRPTADQLGGVLSTGQVGDENFAEEPSWPAWARAVAWGTRGLLRSQRDDLP